jgi:DNA/RNA endonuclease YhcR with UshA esterase domain
MLCKRRFHAMMGHPLKGEFMKAAFALAVVLCASVPILAEEPATTSAPASAPAFAGTFPASDAKAIKDALGKSAVITGSVASVTSPQSGSIYFINFKGNERGQFTGIIKKEHLEAVNKGFDGDVAKALKGKEIELSGVLTSYRDTPQIEVTKPDQIKIVAKPETKKEEK